MAKAGNERSPKRAAGKSPMTVEQYPLDDPRWRPIDEAYEHLVELVRYGDLAARSLQDALEQNRLPFMVWVTATGKRTRLKHTVWIERLMLWFGRDGLRVMLRPQPGDLGYPNYPKPYRDGRVFVWWPDIEALWPTQKTATETDDRHSPKGDDEGYQRRRTAQALLDLYPDGKTTLSTAAVQKDVAAHLEDDSLKRNLSAPSWHTVNRALGREEE